MILSGHFNRRMIRRVEATPVTYPFTFTIAGDCGFQPNPAGDVFVARALKYMEQLAPKPLLFVSLGDFAGPGTAQRHQQYRALLQGLSSPSVCVMGNHELDDETGEANFRDIIGPSNFSFAYGNTLFVAIRSFERGPGTHGPEAADLAFLEQCLKEQAARYPVRIVLMHMPPNLNGHYAPHSGEIWAFKHLESRFLQIVKTHRVTMLCTAHITGYDRYAHEGMTVLVSGAGGGAVGTPYARIFPDQPPSRAGFEHFVELAVQESGAISGRVFRITDSDVHEEPAYGFSCGVS